MKKMTYILNMVVFAIITQFAFANPDWQDDPANQGLQMQIV
jgi:hypothetical protein